MVSLILGAVAAAGSIVGGAVKSHQARVANRKQQGELDALDSENKAYYNRRYYEDATQRADNQRIITQARQAILRDNQAASGTQSVMGSSNATSAATKEANNATLANAVSSVAANSQQYKTHVEDSYRNQNAAIRNKQAQLEYQRGLENQGAVDGAVGAMNSLASAYIAGDKSLEGVKTPVKTSLEGTKGAETVNSIKAKVEPTLNAQVAAPANAIEENIKKMRESGKNPVNNLAGSLSHMLFY